MDLKRRLSAGFIPVQSALDSGRIPGAVLGIINGVGDSAICSGGLAQSVPILRPMQDDTWFDLASLTKVLFTTPRILALAEQNVIDLDSPICSVLKDLRQYDSACWERKVTFRECLTHQSPFPAVEPLYTYGRDANLLRAFVLQREWRAVTPVYSDINFILLGLVLERIEKRSIWQMDAGTGFAFSADPSVCAATEDCTWRHRVLCGEVHDDNCAALHGAGHAGLFGNADAILSAAHKMIKGTGFSRNIITMMRTPESDTRTLGWERCHAAWSGGDNCSAETIGHTGFTGTGLWIDFKAEVAWTLLTNRIHPSRHHDSGISELRQSVSNALMQLPT